MPKPRKPRTVSNPPGAYEFRPVGVPARNIARVFLSIDEYEALRLIDNEQADRTVAADKLDVSQAALTRLVSSAHRKIAEALASGKAIAIEGRSDSRKPNRFRCGTCGHLWAESEQRDIEDVRCPRCEGSRVIDLASLGGTNDFGGYR